jgi:hypothetical protein
MAVIMEFHDPATAAARIAMKSGMRGHDCTINLAL